MNTHLLESLNQPQKVSVQTSEGPLLILSGAGSGKTKTIIHRIAWLIHELKIPAHKIVAVTFTNKAAKEMASRAINIAGSIAHNCVIKTFHSLGLQLLRRFAEYFEYPPNFTIWDDVDQRAMIKNLLPSFYQEELSSAKIKYFINQIASFKDSLIAPDELTEKLDLEDLDLGEILLDLYPAYELAKFNAAAVDFSDLLYKPVCLMRENQEVLTQIQNHYTHFMIDEYQDTNFAQYTMVQLMSSKSGNICVVGDDDQAIYGWRGADVRNILNFEKDFKNTKIVKLEQNYRSTQPILDLANEVIKGNYNRMNKTLFTEKKGGIKPILIEYKSDREEASGIAGIIKKLNTSQPLNQIAILYRTNAQSMILEEALRNAKLPYIVYGGVSFFGRKEIKDILAYLRILVNPLDFTSLLRIINTPKRGVGEKSLQKLLDFWDDFLPERNFIELLSMEDLPIPPKAKPKIKELGKLLEEMNKKVQRNTDLAFLFEDLFERSGLQSMFEEEDRLLDTSRIEQVQELKDSILFFKQENPSAGLNEYLQEISLFSSPETDSDDGDAVQVMTMHNAKGLEFETVFITGLDNQIFPHFLSIVNGSVDEERRLFYVGITRAQKNLYLTRAAKRFHSGKVENTKKSDFLLEINPNLLEKVHSTRLSHQGIQTQLKILHSLPESPEKKFPNTISSKIETKQQQKKVGDLILHSTFGKGRVLRVEGSGDATKVYIAFDDGKTRKLLLKYTTLKKL